MAKGVLFEQLRAGVVTTSADGTQTLAAQLASALPADATLALHGDLGVGKTTFVQGLARGLGIEGAITSPTFTLYHLYRGSRVTLVHLDAYRLESPDQLGALMLEDFLTSPYCLAIEWPDRIAAWLPTETLHLDLSILTDGRAEPAHRVRLR